MFRIFSSEIYFRFHSQHRLTTLLNYDRIIVMENGKIVEEGTPDELRHKVGGKFSSMLYTSIQSYASYYAADEKL